MDYKQLIVDAGMRLARSGNTIETWGNISAVDREKGLMYITPSGVPYDTITPEFIAVCDLEGNWLEGAKKPSIEQGVHAAIFKSRPDVGAIVHTHPVYSTVFSCMGEDIPPIIDEAAQCLGGVVRTAKYALPGSQALADNCVEALGQESNACLMKSHGAVCVGANMNAAFKVSTVLEATAQIYQLIRATGGKPDPISQSDIDTMADFAKNVYGK